MDEKPRLMEVKAAEVEAQLAEARAAARRAKVSETRGGSFVVLVAGSGLIASYAADGWAVAWLAAVILVMCLAVAFLAAAEMTLALEEADHRER